VVHQETITNGDGIHKAAVSLVRRLCSTGSLGEFKSRPYQRTWSRQLANVASTVAWTVRLRKPTHRVTIPPSCNQRLEA